MSTILAETTNTNVPVSCVVNKNGEVTGLTIVCSVYDTVNDTWLDFADDTFKVTPTTQTKLLVYKAMGLYRTTVDVSAAAASARSLTVLYDVTDGGTDGIGADEIILGAQWYDIAGQAELDIVDGVVDDVLGDTSVMQPLLDTNLDVVLSTRASAAALTALETHGDSTWATAAGFAVPGSAMDLVSNAVDAAALATDAVTEIKNSILSDGTSFAGASIATILADTGTDIPATLADMAGAGFVTGTDSLEAIRNRGDSDWVTGAGSSAPATAAAVWDALAASYNTADTMGEALNAAGGAFTPSQVADAVWTEAITDHLGAGQAAQYVSDILADTAAMGPDVVNILADTAAMEPTVTSNLDAAVSSRAVPGGDVNTLTMGTDSISAGALSAAAVSEITTAVAAQITTDHGSGDYLSATGFAVPGSAMVLTAQQEADIVDAVWDESNAAHVIAGSTGESLDTAAQAGSAVNPAAIADAVWDEDRTGHTTAGTFGFYLDAAVSVAGDPSAVATAVWGDTQSGYTTPGTFGYYVDGQITDAGDPAAIADAVWDEAQSSHTTAGTFGFYLDSEVSTAGGGATPAQVADAVWDEYVSQHTTAGTFGENLGTAVSTRAVAGDEMAITSGAESAIANAAADAVWDEAASGHTAGGSFGENLGVAVSSRSVAGDEMALTTAAESDVVDAVWDEAVSQHVGAGSFGENLDAAVSTRAVAGDEMAVTSASEGTIADAVWDEFAASHTTAGTFGEHLGVTVASRTVAGDAMTLTAGADGSIADAVWDEDGADHLTAGTSGYLQDQAATGGAGVTPLQIEQAVWQAEQVSYEDVGSMGKAVSDSQNVPAELEASIDRYFQIVRQYGPIAAQQPIATRDEVHIDDVGIILTVPVILDGAYSDLADATSIDFDFISPTGDASQKAGAGVTTPTGSYTTWTTDDTVFDLVGRWRVQVTVTWPDVSTKSSNVYTIDIQPPMPAL